MTNQVKVLAKAAFADYRGRKFSADFSGKVTFGNLNWGGGSRNEYVAVRMTDKASQSVPDIPPWCNPLEGHTVVIPTGFAVVQRTFFCGKDCGCRVYFPDITTGQRSIAVG